MGSPLSPEWRDQGALFLQVNEKRAQWKAGTGSDTRIMEQRIDQITSLFSSQNSTLRSMYSQYSSPHHNLAVGHMASSQPCMPGTRPSYDLHMPFAKHTMSFWVLSQLLPPPAFQLLPQKHLASPVKALPSTIPQPHAWVSNHPNFASPLRSPLLMSLY